ncbi:unnamed protein product [Arabidopsis thaliana]|uniref:Uncharacterized protein n=1 Tax=Arabidopsis thaliana TaxID=3702 RepID=Q9LJB2_ARATH|nr:unnamed protein product [Arabidopsis thaliana]
MVEERTKILSRKNEKDQAEPASTDPAGWSGQLTLELVDYGSSRVKRCLGQKHPFAPYIREDAQGLWDHLTTSRHHKTFLKVSQHISKLLVGKGVRLGEYNSTELMRMLPPGPTVRWSVEDGEDRSSDGMDREKCSRKHKDKCIRTHPRIAHGCNLTGKGRKHQEWVRNVIHHIGSISRLPSCIYLLSHGETDRRSVRPNGDSMDNQRESPRWEPMDKTDVGHASKPKADGRRISWASLR